MASITKRIKPNGETTYLVQIRVAGAKTISKVFTNPVEAIKFGDREEARVRKSVARFHTPDPADFYKEKFSDVIDRYLTETKPTKKHRSALSVVKRNIGSVCMAELRTKWVKDYIEKLESQLTYRKTPYSHAAIAVHLSVMACVYKWRAEEYDLDLPKLPFSTRHLDKGWEKNRERRLLASEEKTLISVMQGMKTSREWLALLQMALETAARQQELVLATWSEVSADGLLWTIPANHSKTKKLRKIPLTDAAIAALESMKAGKTVQPAERIFAFLSNASSACSAFRKITRIAGIEGFRFHDLRHEAVSRMVLHWQQYNVFEIMQIVGHSSSEMLHRYANLRGDELVAKMRPNIDNRSDSL